MRIAVDIDGVLFPWDDAARQVLREWQGHDLPPSDHWRAIPEAVSDAVWKWLWSPIGQDLVFDRLDAYDDAVDLVRLLLHRGHRVHFITHRDPRITLTYTARFLGYHFGSSRPWAGVHSIKSELPKVGVAPWDLVIDDKPTTVAQVADAGIMAMAPRRTWNESALEAVDHPLVRMYDDPAEVLAWVEDQR